MFACMDVLNSTGHLLIWSKWFKMTGWILTRNVVENN